MASTINVGEGKRLLQWGFIIVFFLVVPAIVLYVAGWLIRLLVDLNNSSITEGSAVSELLEDMPEMLMAFYSGAIGAAVSYIFGRTTLGLDSDLPITKMAKFLFGGALGVTASVFLGSDAFIKFLYPGLAVDQVAGLAVSYQSVIIAAFLAGLTGPAIVRVMHKRSGILGGTRPEPPEGA